MIVIKELFYMKEGLEAVFNQVDVAAFGYHFIRDFAIQDFFEKFFKCKGTACKFIYILFLSSE